MISFTIWGLSEHAWYTILVILAMFWSLIFTKIRTEAAFIMAITALLVGDVLTGKEAFAGFSATSVVVVGVLYVVIAGLTYTGVLNWVVKNLMGLPKTLSGAIARLMFPVALLSSVLSNTTVVALFINVVRMWAKKLGIAPSKLLIPLSYASGMGGICTIIGTPPNLIISGMYADETGQQMSILAPTIPGIVCLLVGVLSMIAMQKMLPVRAYYDGNEGNKADNQDETENIVVGRKTIISSLILLAMVVLSAFNVLPLLTCCLIAACAMVIFKCCNTKQALDAINWNILIVFAGSVAIGQSIENTGIAERIAHELLSICGTNPYVVLFTMCFAATFITEFISNTAAGAMFYPIALSSAQALGVNPMPFLIALMIAASSSFATPIGSPTHMLVYGPGGYRFTDFVKVGVLMNIIILIANVFITTLIYPF